MCDEEFDEEALRDEFMAMAGEAECLTCRSAGKPTGGLEGCEECKGVRDYFATPPETKCNKTIWCMCDRCEVERDLRDDETLRPYDCE